VNPPDPWLGEPSYASLESVRYAMGDTRHYAEQMNLIEMTPRVDLSSTGYALVNPGREYLVLKPSDTSESFSVTLKAGTYAVEWFSINSRKTVLADAVTVTRAKPINFVAPFEGADAAVLYLKKQ
jgi:hypothetical protein